MERERGGEEEYDGREEKVTNGREVQGQARCTLVLSK